MTSNTENHLACITPGGNVLYEGKKIPGGYYQYATSNDGNSGDVWHYVNLNKNIFIACITSWLRKCTKN